jgi:hypothetical protein
MTYHVLHKNGQLTVRCPVRFEHGRYTILEHPASTCCILDDFVQVLCVQAQFGAESHSFCSSANMNPGKKLVNHLDVGCSPYSASEGVQIPRRTTHRFENGANLQQSSLATG